MSDYGNFDKSTGTLNKNTKKTGKGPDYYGSIVVDEEAIRYLIAEVKAGNKMPKLRLSAWLQEGKFGKFISMKASKDNPPQTSARKLDDEVPF